MRKALLLLCALALPVQADFISPTATFGVIPVDSTAPFFAGLDPGNRLVEWTFILAQPADVFVGFAAFNVPQFNWLIDLPSLTGSINGVGTGTMLYEASLAAGSHTLKIGADVIGNYGYLSGVIGVVRIPDVPIPAAAWLFGSALMGLVVVARRKKEHRS